ncbi:MAG: PEP-CTERM sorting domain-containing protein [Isosphaeraceae bacterium]|nr:PEP-CTERM sorting domain-containing protein [Isosphaeraceae bacterium]
MLRRTLLGILLGLVAAVPAEAVPVVSIVGLQPTYGPGETIRFSLTLRDFTQLTGYNFAVGVTPLDQGTLVAGVDYSLAVTSFATGLDYVFQDETEILEQSLSYVEDLSGDMIPETAIASASALIDFTATPYDFDPMIPNEQVVEMELTVAAGLVDREFAIFFPREFGINELEIEFFDYLSLELGDFDAQGEAIIRVTTATAIVPEPGSLVGLVAVAGSAAFAAIRRRARAA